LAERPIIVVEDDPFTRLIPIVLDPDSSEERRAAFADFMAHDEPDFDGWASRLRRRAGRLYPAEVRLVSSEEEMRRHLPDCTVLVVESLNVTREDIEAAPKLRAIQKFGVTLRNIDAAGHAREGVRLLTLRRRANIACAESVFAMMLGLARKVHKLANVISAEQLAEAGYPVRPFDRRHAPGGNYGRVGGLRMLNETTIGIVGMGEIGREIATRAAAFGMTVLYYQRTRLHEIEERELSVHYAPLAALLADSDWVVPQLPGGAATRGLLGRDELAQIKPGAMIVNVSNPDVIDRAALIEALRSGRVGGFALDPLHEEPGRSDDDLLQFDNVLMLPHLGGSPRSNGLRDFEDLITGIAREIES
jgi:phosphoglycerate dehydrogenase-like enzyme